MKRKQRTTYEQYEHDRKIEEIFSITVKTIGWLFLIAVIIVLVVLAIKSSNTFEAKCKEHGGVVKDNGSVNVGVGTNGKPVVVSNPETICVDKDNRIIYID